MSRVRWKGVLDEAAMCTKAPVGEEAEKAHSETACWLVRPEHRGLMCGRRKGAGDKDGCGRGISSSGPPSLQVVHRRGGERTK